jgi:hypothetical protein
MENKEELIILTKEDIYEAYILEQFDIANHLKKLSDAELVASIDADLPQLEFMEDTSLALRDENYETTGALKEEHRKHLEKVFILLSSFVGLHE